MDNEITIDLGRGYVTIVNSDTFHRLRLNSFTWRPQIHKRGKVYAQAYKGGQMVSLHRLIAGAMHEDRVDHRDNNGLNNRDSNVRLATPQQNRGNSRKDRDNQSGFKGVTWAKTSRKWMAQIIFKGKKYYLGVFHHKVRAAIAHDRAALALHGEFAGLNFPNRKTSPKLPQ